ncbi:hypothetical protein [Brevundimonas sp. EYE_349]|mgnify:CR=1 FL=1|uniref:hypothetical protein n=1 Tax=Brevundimonas sp. EYE_349 TaxID=2853455 RepID=UPI002005C7C9|nr:hypothetical protein [Brevundimonas sp. EYE_349]MCK6103336.1 hypothetical protein [Brevundimonas sp. EYE_349]
MRDGLYDTKQWLRTCIRLAFSDVTLASDPDHSDHDAALIANAMIARDWMSEIDADPTPSTIIQFITDDDELIQEAVNYIGAEDQASSLKPFIMVGAASPLKYVVVRIQRDTAAVAFKMWINGRDMDWLL